MAVYEGVLTCYALALLAAVCQAATLATVKFDNYQPTSASIKSNFVGLSIPFQQIYSSGLTSTLLQDYIKNSWVYGTSVGSWGLSIKVQWPLGYNYDCAAYLMLYPNTTCTVDVKNYFSSLGQFYRSATNNYLGLSVGYNMVGSESSSFLASQLMNLGMDIQMNVGFVGSGTLNVDLFDKANLFASTIRPDFTPASFLSEAISNWWALPQGMNGPGITEDADISWMDTYEQFVIQVPQSTFTVYAVPFKTDSQLTVQNVLNQTYYNSYILKRFTASSGVLDPTIGSLGITDLRMNSGNGVNGVTNSMASAIWALDFMVECARFGLSRVLMNVDFSSSSLQGPFGPGPNYEPRPIYYSLLMMSILAGVQSSLPSFLQPTVMGGASGNIKVYGFHAGDKLKVLLISKDTSSSASGEVQLRIDSEESIKCIYMSADSLTSSNVTLAGYRFVAGNATPQGTFAQYSFQKLNGVYKVKLSYAQVALCSLTSPQNNFVQVSANQSYLFLLMSIILALLSL